MALSVSELESAARILVALCCLGAFLLVPAPMASAETQGEAIVAAAASMAGKPYCFDGGNESGPTHGRGNEDGATQCGSQSITGFDCTGLTQYAAYQGTGGAVDLTHHDSEQAKYAPGPWITSEAALQPGDIVYFGSSRDDITHSAVYAGVVGGQQMIWDADTVWPEFPVYPDGVQERQLRYENSLGFVGAARVGSGSAGGGGGGADDPVGSYDLATSPRSRTIRIAGWAFDPDAKTSPVTIHAYVGGEAGQAGAEGHNLGAAGGYRPDVGSAYPGVGDNHGFDFTFETSKVGSLPVCVYAINIGAGGNVLLGCRTVAVAARRPFDVNGDGDADACLLTGLNGGTTGSGHLEVHCALGPGFTSRSDSATPFDYVHTPSSLPYLADVNGDGDADACLLTGLDGNTTGSGHLEVHCALGPSFSSRTDSATPFGYISTQTSLPFFADVNGDGDADLCLLTGLNGATTGSGHTEVHCALGPGFSSRTDSATPFGYLNTTTALPFFADVNGDGDADACFLTGLNGGTTGSGHLEVHCALGPSFSSRSDSATPFGYINPRTALPYFADANGDGDADLCLLTGLNESTTGSGHLEVHCALGPGFTSRSDSATPFGYMNTQTAQILDSLATAPTAPANVSATAALGAASVSFSPPPYDGGNPISSYTVTASPGGAAATGTSSPINIPGLHAGTAYSFTVTASNAFGPGLASAASNRVVPGGPSGANAPASTGHAIGSACQAHGSRCAKRGHRKCVVPKLRGLSVNKARRRLTGSHCALGRVTEKRRHRRVGSMHVRGQGARPGTSHRPRYPVGVVVG